MTKPVRLQLSRRKGFDLQAHSRAVNGLPAVKVDRSTRWGNPYKAARNATYGWCAQGAGKFELVRNEAEARRKLLELFRHRAMRCVVEDLRGSNLACWCALDQSCHADILLELANGEGSK